MTMDGHYRQFLEIITLRGGYNSLVVLFGSGCLGVLSGVVGSFVLLRKRAMVSDALAHSTFPGLTLGFLCATALGLPGKSLPFLMVGSALSAWAGVLVIQWIKDKSRLPEDAAIGSVLSGFFGLGTVLLSYIQNLRGAGQAGLEGYLLGSTASMLRSEALLIAGVSLGLVAIVTGLRKELFLLSFDRDFASVQGWSATRIDLILMMALLATVVIGLKVVGLTLIIALLITPAATARLWTNSLKKMLLIAGVVGFGSCYFGAGLSAAFPKVPSGATIVLVSTFFFALSFFIAPQRGLLANSLARFKVHRQAQERLFFKGESEFAVAQAPSSQESNKFRRQKAVKSSRGRGLS